MKKAISLLLVCLMLLGTVSAVMAEDVFDLTFVRDNPDNYDLDINEASDCAFVESTLEPKERAFTHKDESDALYSHLWFDALVLDYSKSTRYPVFRLWIVLCTENAYKYVDSVTFIVDGESFTFTGIDDSEWYEIKEGDYRQEMLIKFGKTNVSFLIALENFCKKVAADDYSGSYDVRMVLHGREDIETTLGLNFLIDFLRIRNVMLNCNGLAFLDKAIETEMR